ncbi:hypothetical protein ACFV42_23365 [Streptomyces solisilvae]|uniref:hypothetical protein n=1 Tax=Streptomyces malaysiensis TaxID=92644 RepID=UPI0036BEEC55
MALSRCAPRVEIAPPASRPRRFGLFTAADVREVEDGTWSHGVQYRTESCSGSVYTWPKPCPPECDSACTEPVPIVVEIVHDTEETNCTAYSVIRARVKQPAAPADLPYKTVITVDTAFGPSVDIVPGTEDCTTIARRAQGSSPQPVTVTVRQSLNGEEKTLKVAPGTTAQASLTADKAAPRRKVLDGIGPWIGSDPFPVYSTVHCTPGGDFAKEARGIARNRLMCREECAVEEYLWTQLAADGGQYIGDPSNPKTITCAMAEIEAALMQARGCSAGVLHVPARLSLPLSVNGCCLIEEEGASLRTRMGTEVVFGACYDPRMRPDGVLADPDLTVIIGTGPIIIQRGPISTYEGLDKQTNDYAAVAERTYAVIADCPLVWTIADTCNC